MNKVLSVIPTYMSQGHDLEVTLAAITSLHATADTEILVVDDCSPRPGILDALVGAATKAGVDLGVVAKEENSGFSQTVNVGLELARDKGMDALLVNSDIEFFEEGWLDAMLATDAAVVGALLLYPNGLIQHAGVYFSLLARGFAHIYQYGPADLPEAHQPRVCPVTGALQLIRHECLSEIGIYDPGFSMSLEDVDYCLQVFKSGRECIYQPAARATHHESLFRGRASAKVADWERRAQIRLLAKWSGFDFSPFVPSLF